MCIPGSLCSLTILISPSAVTISTSTRLSMLSPYCRLRKPNPPESITPVPTGKAAKGTWYDPSELLDVQASTSLCWQPAPNVAYATAAGGSLDGCDPRERCRRDEDEPEDEPECDRAPGSYSCAPENRGLTRADEGEYDSNGSACPGASGETETGGGGGIRYVGRNEGRDASKAGLTQVVEGRNDCNDVEVGTVALWSVSGIATGESLPSSPLDSLPLSSTVSVLCLLLPQPVSSDTLLARLPALEPSLEPLPLPLPLALPALMLVAALADPLLPKASFLDLLLADEDEWADEWEDDFVGGGGELGMLNDGGVWLGVARDSDTALMSVRSTTTSPATWMSKEARGNDRKGQTLSSTAADRARRGPRADEGAAIRLTAQP